jgi:hypothetical protein
MTVIGSPSLNVHLRESRKLKKAHNKENEEKEKRQ